MTNAIAGRDTAGRFATGNLGGPGRPRRAVELDYLMALADVVDLDAWREVVRVALVQAAGGDAKARDWLAGYLLGPARPDTLLNLAADDLAGSGPGALVARKASDRENARTLEDAFSGTAYADYANLPIAGKIRAIHHLVEHDNGTRPMVKLLPPGANQDDGIQK
ncbi:hypothetical protein TA3x_005856 (plasmid) [Tundrisphaera sp. TA3]|uniref:hypothetical protein n=1 Tax=Tundrisphaera sp. TA3 TaxID=3435775 RepID=UPI003EBD4F80